jgi:hypothetical protein
MRPAIATAVLLSGAAAAQSAPIVLDYNAFTMGASLGSVSEDGFTTGVVSYGLGSIEPGGNGCSPPCPWNGTSYVFFAYGTLTIAAMGQPFDLLSFDGAEGFQGAVHATATGIQVTGSKADASTVVASFSLDWVHDGEGPLEDFESFDLPPTFKELISAEFTAIGEPVPGPPIFTLDNVNVSLPEPSATILLAIVLARFFAVMVAPLLSRRVRVKRCGSGPSGGRCASASRERRLGRPTVAPSWRRSAGRSRTWRGIFAGTTSPRAMRSGLSSARSRCAPWPTEPATDSGARSK